jgi:hypothetical protein
MEAVMANLATAAMIVQDSRRFGRFPETTMKTAARRETSTAANGFIEKYVSIF